jgi:flagellar capping protein FliD
MKYRDIRERITKLEADLTNQRREYKERFEQLDAAIHNLSLKYDEIIKNNKFLVRQLNSQRRKAA